jgi:L-aspartate oxidase
VAQLARWDRLVSRPFGTRLELEVKNLVQVARCIAEAALWRQNSVGAHYRADFPTAAAGWRRHSVVRVGEELRTRRPAIKPAG